MSLASMTAEMLRSEAPCAIARTLMPALPSVPKNRPALPGMPAMSSPTTAMIAQPFVTPTRCTCPSLSSTANARSTTVRTWSAASSRTAKQIECSELPCEISMTDTPASRSAPNSRSAVPGTPIMPAPSRFTSATLSTPLMPLTAAAREPDDAEIFVPGCVALNVLRIHSGMPRPTAGAIVCG